MEILDENLSRPLPRYLTLIEFENRFCVMLMEETFDTKIGFSRSICMDNVNVVSNVEEIFKT